MMSIEQAIEHAEEVATEQELLMGRYDAASGYMRSGNEAIRTESSKECEKCAAEHKQLAAWLRELQETRKERDYWQEKVHSYEQTIFKLTDAISKQPEIIRCKDCDWWTKQADSVQGRCELLGMYPAGGWYCANARRRTDK